MRALPHVTPLALAHVDCDAREDCVSVACPRASECRYTLKLYELQTIVINESSAFPFHWLQASNGFVFGISYLHSGTCKARSPSIAPTPMPATSPSIDPEFLPKPRALELIGALRKLVSDTLSPNAQCRSLRLYHPLPILMRAFAHNSTLTTRSNEILFPKVAEPGMFFTQ